MHPHSATRLAVPRHPVWVNSFLSTKLDALILIEAYLARSSFLFPIDPKDDRPFVASGFIFLYDEYDATGVGEPDTCSNWSCVDEDRFFEVSQSADSSGLTRKRASFCVDEIRFHLVSYYREWDTVNGTLVPPSRCLDFQDVSLRESLATQNDLLDLSPMEEFRWNMEDLGRDQFEFKRLVACLIFSSTDESYYRAFLKRDEQLLFPLIRSEEAYWQELSTLLIFKGKTYSELQCQTFNLVTMLLMVANQIQIPPLLELSQDFLPLQNLCLYLEAFGVRERPLGALQPLDEARLAGFALESRRFPHDTSVQPQMMESWDLRKVLPIDCPGYGTELTPAFMAVFSQESASDQAAVRMGIEHLCEQFPLFRDPEYRDLLLLHQCFYRSTVEEVSERLRDWAHTGDGKRTISLLWKIFQAPLEPEALALALADMLLLWTLDPPVKKRGLQSLPSNLSGLGQLLSQPSLLRDNYYLLLDLYASLYDAVVSLKIPKWIPITQFLKEEVCFMESASPTQEFRDYFVVRLVGRVMTR